jgi:hypothetical protein
VGLDSVGGSSAATGFYKSLWSLSEDMFCGVWSVSVLMGMVGVKSYLMVYNQISTVGSNLEDTNLISDIARTFAL